MHRKIIDGKNKNIWRIILFLLFLTIILWSAGYLESIAFRIQYSFNRFFYNLQRTFDDIKSYITITESLQKEIAELQTEILSLYKENQNLKLILENIKKREDYIPWLKDLADKNIEIIYADIVGRDPIKWNLELKVNKGYLDKVKVGMPVLYKDQVVGRVVRTEKHYSIVRTIYDPNFVLGVTVLETKDQGILRGGYDHMEMAYLFSDHGIKEGNTIITSGTEDNIPYGLKIGYIADLKEKAIFSFSNMKILPFEDISNIEGVAICVKF
jgi:rod shape-determining protein MreC